MRHYVLDAHALIRYIRDAEGASKVNNLFVQADARAVSLSISAINLTEVLYVAARFLGLEKAEEAIQRIHGLVDFVPVSLEDAYRAGRIRLHYKLGLADCFAAELAMRTGATLVTADPEFARLGKQLKVVALPRHKE